MAHYAELNENNEVIYVCYVPNDYIKDENGNEVEQLGIDHLKLHHGSERRWVQTSRSRSFRKNWGAEGHIYDEDLDAFIPPKPQEYPSWILNEDIGLWEPPIQKPELSQEQIDNFYYYTWNEANMQWDMNCLSETNS